MPARMRCWWLSVVLGLTFGSQARADSLVASPDGWNWWALGWAAGSTTNAGSGGFASPVSTAAPATTLAPSADAFINLGSGPYSAASSLATGNAQPWYTSSQVGALFGGQPSAQQQVAFNSTVLQLVQQAFQQSGVSVNLTTDPTVSAAHTLSVVSGATSSAFPGSIGTTEIGGSGFSFIDQIARSAQNVGQLEQVVAHNVAHELMLAFGVPEKYDQSGKYIDSTNANWSMMTSSTATFSPAAAQAINQALQSQNGAGASSSLPQYISPQPVPEPASLILWGLACATFLGARSARSHSLASRRPGPGALGTRS